MCRLEQAPVELLQGISDRLSLCFKILVSCLTQGGSNTKHPQHRYHIIEFFAGILLRVNTSELQGEEDHEVIPQINNVLYF